MRYQVRTELGGRRFEDVLVDIVFSDPLKWEPEKIARTDLLEFAGIEPIEVPVLPLEQHVAEKVPLTREPTQAVAPVVAPRVWWISSW